MWIQCLKYSSRVPPDQPRMCSPLRKGTGHVYGLPPPRDQSTLPILKRVLDGIRRCKSLEGSHVRMHLPVAPAVLRHIRAPLIESNDPDRLAFWAFAVTAFFGIFHLGKLLLESEASYTPSLHLSWRDVAIDARSAMSMLKIHLKKSKCDQFGNGADILPGAPAVSCAQSQPS